MNKILKYMIPAAALLLSVGVSSCTGDLDKAPIDPNLVTKDKIEPEQSFNKCYATFATAGNGGANGDCDIDGLDGGTTGYVRQMWNANELTSDEAICGWGDEGINEFCFNAYDASHPMLRGYFNRLYASIAYANQYIDDFGSYNETMTAEVRFLRAFSYFQLLDCFANVPFALHVQTELPPRYTRAQLYEWLETELLEVEPLLSEARPKKSSDANYGRVDKAACWLLLARLYLNSEVYVNTNRYADAAIYAKKVMDSSYSLNTGAPVNGFSRYHMLFMGDNGETDAANEAIFPLLQDGIRTTSWGTSLFMMASTFDGNVHANPNDYTATGNGTTEAWGGNRARPSLIAKFFPNEDCPQNLSAYETAAAAGDDRALFDSYGRNLSNGSSISEEGVFTNGYAICKYVNFKSDGSAGHSTQFPDADFFLMRKAEAYLTYAEALMRQNGGNANTDALDAINALRSRANATPMSSCNLDRLLDEWSREFYFEGRRRHDLVRFGQYSGSDAAKWPWKGGVANGRNIDKHLDIFAIPTQELNANKNLIQNPGY